MTSKPLVSRTLATLRSAELGFFGVVVYTRVHTPRFCGLPPSAGTLLLVWIFLRPLRSNWLIVGMFSRYVVWEAPGEPPACQGRALSGPKPACSGGEKAL